VTIIKIWRWATKY